MFLGYILSSRVKPVVFVLSIVGLCTFLDSFHFLPYWKVLSCLWVCTKGSDWALGLNLVFYLKRVFFCRILELAFVLFWIEGGSHCRTMQMRVAYAWVSHGTRTGVHYGGLVLDPTRLSLQSTVLISILPTGNFSKSRPLKTLFRRLELRNTLL